MFASNAAKLTSTPIQYDFNVKIRRPTDMHVAHLLIAQNAQSHD